MKVLSLFDGISCGRVALERAGIPVEVYYASEIDKYAMSVAQAMYPDTIQIGDVCKIDFTQYIGKVDMIIGGSPCQDLSIAKQNRQGLQGERSRLFWEYIKALTIIKPKYFLLENVASMRNEDRDAITAVLRGIYPETECIMINSALVSAQRRKRYYWTNWHVEQPQDKGILLKDVLETAQESIELVPFVESKLKDIEQKFGEIPAMFNPYNKQKITDKAPTQTCQCASQTKSSTVIMFEPVGCRMVGRNTAKNGPLQQRIEINGNPQKANCISTVAKDSMICEPVRIGTLPNLGKGQANRIYSVRGKSVCLNANGGGGGAKTGLYKIDLPDGDYIVRKLTPRECARLQTYPERCFDVANISNTQWYKAFGNGWTCDVIAHIFKGLKLTNASTAGLKRED